MTDPSLLRRRFHNQHIAGKPAGKPEDVVRLLTAFFIPEYDEALTGYRDLGRPDLPPGKPDKSWRDVFYRPLVVGYRRAGTWKRTIGPKAASMELNLFAKLDEVQWKAVDAAVDRYSEFLEMPVTIANRQR